MNTNKNIFDLSTNCLDRKTMFDYIDHKLSNAQMHQVEKHLTDCDFCTDALEGLTTLNNRELLIKIDNKLQGVELAPEKKVFFLFDKRWQVAAGLLFILVLSFLTIYIISPKLSDKAEEAAVATITEKGTIASMPPIEEPQANNKVPSSKLNTDNIALKATEKESKVNKVKADDVPKMLAMETATERKNNNGIDIADQQEVIVAEKDGKDANVGIKLGPAPKFDNNNMASNAIIPNMADGDVSLAPRTTNKSKIKLEPETSTQNNDETGDNYRFESIKKDTEKDASPTTIGTTNNVLEKEINEVADVKTTLTISGGETIENQKGLQSVAHKQAVTKNTSTAIDATTTPSSSSNGSTIQQQDVINSDYTTGINLYKKAQYKKCISYFDKVIKANNTTHINDALWHKALSLIKLNKKKEAKLILQKIIADNTKYKLEAEKQLKNLQ